MNYTEITRYFKNGHGEVRRMTTNCDPLRKKMIAATDKVNDLGYIYRKTPEEAENDPTPTITEKP